MKSVYDMPIIQAEDRRYYATEENGKGYIYDREFSAYVPIAVETTYREAAAMAEKFNREE